ncbi:Cilia- and flagella-associated protein 52 [Acipenser ruthenus]|uniref:Cilia- and flagella-associated protein 52 n=1 Tax=Acipenser ruthenus TaxID=7906 RepID=A0A444UQ85_ACIRT|nr:Cilia- and flagella-associated protein 52 [Acipenser ruthenus]
MARETHEAVPPLELESVIGFNGRVPTGLNVHPDGEHLVYPLGCTIIIQALRNRTQEFLHGHTNNVSYVTVSRSGQYIASGQVTFMGFKADIIIWDYSKREIHARLTLHKAKVEALAFSPNDLYLVSLGGQDDGSVVVWNVAKGEAVCGSPASAPSAGNCLTVKFSNNNDAIFITAGNSTLRVWDLDLPNRKIHPTECQTGQLKRIVTCLEISDDDSFFFCGTSSGDILTVNLKTKLLNSCAPQKKKFSLGVTALKTLKTGDMLVGSGDGVVSLCKGTPFKVIKKVELVGGVTSISLRGQGHQFFTGSDAAQIYRFNYTEFKEELVGTCHNEAVYDISFPLIQYEDCFVTRALSAWNDGKIRVFTPESGKLIYAINNAHSMGVTAIAATSDCKKIISGGGEGQVRVWEIGKGFQRLIEAMKEHKSSVSCIKVKRNNTECVTASSDGTCIIWDLVRFVRNHMVLSNTLFRCVCYHTEEFQIITSGSDRKIGYWEVFDGSPIRELEGSLSGSINGMDISPDGTHFVTGGDDKLVKVWGYNEGEVTHVGIGHSGSITRIKVCPNARSIISISADGAILRWKYPLLS